jgi:hypothetical protein
VQSHLLTAALLGWLVQPHVPLLLLFLLLPLCLYAGRSSYCCIDIFQFCLISGFAVQTNSSVLGGLRKPW